MWYWYVIGIILIIIIFIIIRAIIINKENGNSPVERRGLVKRFLDACCKSRSE